MAVGLLDTSVLVDLAEPDLAAALPDQSAISAISLAELASGPHLATTADERAGRQARLQQVEAMFEPLPFDVAAARSYGQIVAAVAENGRSHRRRVGDLLIAATAHANGLGLYTRHPGDFAGLERLVEIVGI